MASPEEYLRSGDLVGIQTLLGGARYHLGRKRPNHVVTFPDPPTDTQFEETSLWEIRCLYRKKNEEVRYGDEVLLCHRYDRTYLSSHTASHVKLVTDKKVCRFQIIPAASHVFGFGDKIQTSRAHMYLQSSESEISGSYLELRKDGVNLTNYRELMSKEEFEKRRKLTGWRTSFAVGDNLSEQPLKGNIVLQVIVFKDCMRIPGAFYLCDTVRLKFLGSKRFMALSLSGLDTQEYKMVLGSTAEDNPGCLWQLDPCYSSASSKLVSLKPEKDKKEIKFGYEVKLINKFMAKYIRIEKKRFSTSFEASDSKEFGDAKGEEEFSLKFCSEEEKASIFRFEIPGPYLPECNQLPPNKLLTQNLATHIGVTVYEDEKSISQYWLMQRNEKKFKLRKLGLLEGGCLKLGKREELKWNDLFQMERVDSQDLEDFYKIWYTRQELLEFDKKYLGTGSPMGFMDGPIPEGYADSLSKTVSDMINLIDKAARSCVSMDNEPVLSLIEARGRQIPKQQKLIHSLELTKLMAWMLIRCNEDRRVLDKRLKELSVFSDDFACNSDMLDISEIVKSLEALIMQILAFIRLVSWKNPMMKNKVSNINILTLKIDTYSGSPFRVKRQRMSKNRLIDYLWEWLIVEKTPNRHPPKEGAKDSWNCYPLAFHVLKVIRYLYKDNLEKLTEEVRTPSKSVEGIEEKKMDTKLHTQSECELYWVSMTKLVFRHNFKSIWDQAPHFLAGFVEILELPIEKNQMAAYDTFLSKNSQLVLGGFSRFNLHIVLQAKDEVNTLQIKICKPYKGEGSLEYKTKGNEHKEIIHNSTLINLNPNQNDKTDVKSNKVLSLSDLADIESWMTGIDVSKAQKSGKNSSEFWIRKGALRYLEGCVWLSKCLCIGNTANIMRMRDALEIKALLYLNYTLSDRKSNTLLRFKRSILETIRVLYVIPDLSSLTMLVRELQTRNMEGIVTYERSVKTKIYELVSAILSKPEKLLHFGNLDYFHWNGVVRRYELRIVEDVINHRSRRTRRQLLMKGVCTKGDGRDPDDWDGKWIPPIFLAIMRYKEYLSCFDVRSASNSSEWIALEKILQCLLVELRHFTDQADATTNEVRKIHNLVLQVSMSALDIQDQLINIISLYLENLELRARDQSRQKSQLKYQKYTVPQSCVDYCLKVLYFYLGMRSTFCRKFLSQMQKDRYKACTFKIATPKLLNVTTRLMALVTPTIGTKPRVWQFNCANRVADCLLSVCRIHSRFPRLFRRRHIEIVYSAMSRLRRYRTNEFYSTEIFLCLLRRIMSPDPGNEVPNRKAQTVVFELLDSDGKHSLNLEQVKNTIEVFKTKSIGEIVDETQGFDNYFRNKDKKWEEISSAKKIPEYKKKDPGFSAEAKTSEKKRIMVPREHRGLVDEKHGNRNVTETITTPQTEIGGSETSDRRHSDEALISKVVRFGEEKTVTNTEKKGLLGDDERHIEKPPPIPLRLVTTQYEWNPKKDNPFWTDWKQRISDRMRIAFANAEKNKKLTQDREFVISQETCYNVRTVAESTWFDHAMYLKNWKKLLKEYKERKIRTDNSERLQLWENIKEIYSRETAKFANKEIKKPKWGVFSFGRQDEGDFKKETTVTSDYFGLNDRLWNSKLNLDAVVYQPRIAFRALILWKTVPLPPHIPNRKGGLLKGGTHGIPGDLGENQDPNAYPTEVMWLTRPVEHWIENKMEVDARSADGFHFLKLLGIVIQGQFPKAEMKIRQMIPIDTIVDILKREAQWVTRENKSQEPSSTQTKELNFRIRKYLLRFLQNTYVNVTLASKEDLKKCWDLFFLLIAKEMTNNNGIEWRSRGTWLNLRVDEGKNGTGSKIGKQKGEYLELLLKYCKYALAKNIGIPPTFQRFQKRITDTDPAKQPTNKHFHRKTSGIFGKSGLFPLISRKCIDKKSEKEDVFRSISQNILKQKEFELIVKKKGDVCVAEKIYAQILHQIHRKKEKTTVITTKTSLVSLPSHKLIVRALYRNVVVLPSGIVFGILVWSVFVIPFILALVPILLTHRAYAKARGFRDDEGKKHGLYCLGYLELEQGAFYCKKCTLSHIKPNLVLMEASVMREKNEILFELQRNIDVYKRYAQLQKLSQKEEKSPGYLVNLRSIITNNLLNGVDEKIHSQQVGENSPKKTKMKKNSVGSQVNNMQKWGAALLEKLDSRDGQGNGGKRAELRDGMAKMFSRMRDLIMNDAKGSLLMYQAIVEMLEKVSKDCRSPQDMDKTFDRLDHESPVNVENVAVMHLLAVDLKLAEMSVDMIVDSFQEDGKTSRKGTKTSLGLRMANLLLNTGDPDIQAEYLRIMSNDKHNKVLTVIHDILADFRRMVHTQQQQSSRNLRYDGDEVHLVEMGLGYLFRLCMGGNDSGAQDYLRDQAGDRDHNLVSDARWFVSDISIPLQHLLKEDNIPYQAFTLLQLVRNALRFLSEACYGPNIANQTLLGTSSFFYKACTDILSVCLERMRKQDARKANQKSEGNENNEETVDVNQKTDREIRAMLNDLQYHVMRALQSTLEGQNLTTIAWQAEMLDNDSPSCPLPALLVMLRNHTNYLNNALLKVEFYQDLERVIEGDDIVMINELFAYLSTIIDSSEPSRVAQIRSKLNEWKKQSIKELANPENHSGIRDLSQVLVQCEVKLANNKRGRIFFVKPWYFLHGEKKAAELVLEEMREICAQESDEKQRMVRLFPASYRLWQIARFHKETKGALLFLREKYNLLWGLTYGVVLIVNALLVSWATVTNTTNGEPFHFNIRGTSCQLRMDGSTIVDKDGVSCKPGFTGIFPFLGWLHLVLASLMVFSYLTSDGIAEFFEELAPKNVNENAGNEPPAPLGWKEKVIPKNPFSGLGLLGQLDLTANTLSRLNKMRFYTMYLLCALLSVAHTPMWTTFHLVDIVNFFSTFKTIVIVADSQKLPLFATVALGLLVVYVFTVLIFVFFHERVILGGEGLYTCETLWGCLENAVDYGFRNTPEFTTDPISVVTPSFDLLYYLLINTVVVAIITGIIIDAFADMRADRDKAEEELQNKCFVCGMNSDVFERSRNHSGFLHHVTVEHCPSAYLYLKHHILLKAEKAPIALNNAELHVAKHLQEGKVWQFLPESALGTLHLPESENPQLADSSASPAVENIDPILRRSNNDHHRGP